MRLSKALKNLGLVAVCAAVLGTSAKLFAEEYQAIFFLRGTPNEQIDQLVAGGEPIPLPRSSRTTRDLLAACGRIISTSPRLRAEPELVSSVLRECRALADSILENSPSHARALALGLLADSSIPTQEAIQGAQMASRYEPWPATTRFDAYARIVDPDAATRKLMKADLARAMQFSWARQEAARLYRDHPSLRVLILEAAKELPNREQSQFVGAMRRAMSGAF